MDTKNKMEEQRNGGGNKLNIPIGTNEKIAENFQDFRNFLKNICGLSDEKDIHAIKNFMEIDKRFNILPQFYNELKLIYNDEEIKEIKDCIYPGLLESYGNWIDQSQIKLSKNLLISLICNTDSHPISHLEKLLIESCISSEGLRDLTLDEVVDIIEELIKYNEKSIKEDIKYSYYYKARVRTYENMLNELREKGEYKGKGNFEENHIGNQDIIVNTEGIIGCIENKDRDEVKSCLIGAKNDTLNREIFEKLLNNDEYDDEKLIVYIDKFNGLKDSDLIDLYFRLYPDRDKEKGRDNFINECIDQIDNDRELTDFIDLIKTTGYWTDDVRDKCFDKARKMNMWCYIVNNYAMGYFNNKELIEKDLIENDFNGLDLSLIGYSHLFHDLEEFKDKVKKDTEWTCVADFGSNLSYFRKCIVLMENRKELGNRKGAINSHRSWHLI